MADYSGYQYLKCEKEGKVLLVTLNRPERLNAISREMHREVEDVWLKLGTDREVNVVVLTGAGKAFCSGGDVKRQSERADSTAERTVAAVRAGSGGRRLLVGLLEVEQPIICAMNGDAVGLGATLALFCDTVIAAEGSRIGDPHVRVGLVAGDGGAVIWPLLCGVNRAKELLMTGDLISAAEAERIGLINHVVPKEEVLPIAKELAHRLANGPILAIKWSKISVNQLLRQNLNLIIDTSLALEHLTMLSEDHKEASKAFTEKRPPNYTGQ